MVDGGIVFAARRGMDVRREVVLPCGQCVGCKLERSRQWAVRCTHEAQMFDVNSFVTLTYDEEHVPEDHGLHYREFQLFMKRLRKTGRKARFFMCGEYGGVNGRPHFHACLFGVSFPDRVFYRELGSGSKIYTSAELSRLWPCGFSSVGDVTFESAAYVARYVLKKVGNDVERLGVLDMSTGELQLRASEFVRMSLKPGIGFEWFKKYLAEVYPRDFVIVRGMKCKPPRYYDKLLESESDTKFDSVELDRFVRAMAAVADGTPERLSVREAVCKARLAFKVRSLPS